MQENSTLKSNTGVQPQKENFFKELSKFVLIALAIVIPIRVYVAQPFIVSGASMDPTFKTGQYLIVDELTYHFKNPKRGQVVIFKFPKEPSLVFIKRIIGLPGETVIINKGKVTIKNAEYPNGFELEEPYVANEHAVTDSFTAELGTDEYFVMGDNRAESSDSRAWGNLDRDHVIGQPVLRIKIWPIPKFETFPGAYDEAKNYQN